MAMMDADRASPRLPIVGLGVDMVTMRDALDRIHDLVDSGNGGYVCVRDVHGVVAARDNIDLRIIHEQADLVVPDGMPLVWAGRWRGATVSRVSGPDLVLALCREGIDRGYRHYFYGGAPGIANRMARLLSYALPELIVVGAESPPFRPLSEQEDDQGTARIRAARPDIVWIGLGTPKQERWMADHKGRLDGAVMIGVGAAFDIYGGGRRRAPSWMQRAGLEWAYRLRQEPHRLWRRYLFAIPRFLLLVFAESTGLVRRPGASR